MRRPSGVPEEDVKAVAIGQVPADVLERQVHEALNLLRRTYRPIDDHHGGWYHDLTDAPPGPVATAVALLAFRLAGESVPFAAPSWAFLRQRQNISEDPKIHGGWAQNIAGEQSTVEATTAVLELIGRGRFAFATFAPDTPAGITFLTRQQNSDGGWGSCIGNPSRTALTARALSALASLNPDHEAIDQGMRWLLKHVTTAGGWGEIPGGNPTLAHTGLALQALTACGAGRKEAAIDRGFSWLAEKVLSAPLGHGHSYVEAYDVTAATGPHPYRWRETLHHHGLGIALVALLGQPSGPPPDALRVALGTILRGQRSDGSWPAQAGAPPPTLWPLWHSISALISLRNSSLLWPGSTMIIFDDVIAVRRSSAPNKPLRALIATPRRARLVRFLRRRWASVILIAAMAVSLGMGAFRLLEWNDALLGLLLPVALLAFQETVARIGHRKSADR